MINLTPHTVKLILDDGTTVDYPPDPAGPVRLHTDSEPSNCGAFPVGTVVQRVRGLPPLAVRLEKLCESRRTEASGPIVLIVAGVVLDALADGYLARHLVAPDTGPDSAVRDDAGRIVGVRRFRARY